MRNYALGFMRNRETPAITKPTTKMIADGKILLVPKNPVAADSDASGVQTLLIRLIKPIAAIKIPIAVPQSLGEPQTDFLLVSIASSSLNPYSNPGYFLLRAAGRFFQGHG